MGFQKYLFLHFIHSELAYHTAALEKLSSLYKNIQDIEPIEKLPDFVGKYSLDSVGDLREYGYDAKKIERRNRRGGDNRSDLSGDTGNNMNLDGTKSPSNPKKSKVKSILDDDGMINQV